MTSKIDLPTDFRSEAAFPSAKIERVLQPSAHAIDDKTESDFPTIRPTRFDDYPGQDTVKENLKVYVEAAKRRGSALDHALFHGPPGLGKTTLAQIVAGELGVPFHATSGPAIDKPGDLVGILLGLEERSVLFIDEIHRLNTKIEEILYPALEDFKVDFITGQGASARTYRIDVAPFTLIAATTRLSLLSRPLLARFGIQERLDFYDDDSLVRIIERSSSIIGVSIEASAAREIARRSRGTPRLANRLLRRVRDFAEFDGCDVINLDVADKALLRQGVDAAGLDRGDRAVLGILAERYDGGPVGIETLAATLNEDRATIEDVYEPFLVHRGFISRGPRGRELTPMAWEHLKRNPRDLA